MSVHTLWKGPKICSPAYDLKLRLTKCVIIRRGAPGSLVIAGGGGGGMLARISSKLRLSAASVASPWDGSVAQQKKYNFFCFILLERVVSGGGRACGGGVRSAHIHKIKTNKHTQHVSVKNNAYGEKVDMAYFPLCSNQEPAPKEEK